MSTLSRVGTMPDPTWIAPVEDIRILTRAQGSEFADGRTVEALVAVWDNEAEVNDYQGHYIETIGRNAFDRALDHARPQGSRAAWKVGVFYNHGMSLHGTPSDTFSVPLGSPVNIRADAAGLLTVTRYNETPLAEQILETIRAGDIRGHSFTGRIIRSEPQRVPRGGFKANTSGVLPRVHRTELGLREYGPTPFPVYADATVVGVRSLVSATQPLLEIDPEELPDPAETGTPDDSGPATDDPPDENVEHSSGSVARRAAIALRTRLG